MEYVLRDASPEERVLPWEIRREKMAERILKAMAAAGLTSRERDAYWLHVGCQTSFGEIGLLLDLPGGRLAAKQAAFRAFDLAQDKLAEWVTAEGIVTSPLYRERLLRPEADPLGHKAVTTLALRVEGQSAVAAG